MGCIGDQLPDVSQIFFYYLHRKKTFYLSGKIKLRIMKKIKKTRNIINKMTNLKMKTFMKRIIISKV